METSKKSRELSLDVFRGIAVVLMILGNGSEGKSFEWLKHSDWNGWTLIDLVFPFFIWVMGYSIGITRNPNKSHGFKHILMRTARTFIMGLILELFAIRFLLLKEPLRVMGVLQRLSLCFLVISLVHLFMDNVYLQIIFFSLLQAIYFYLMYYFSVPPHRSSLCGRGVITKECSAASYFDRQILGQNHLFLTGSYDPEGLFSTFSAITTCGIGLLISHIMHNQRYNSWKKLMLTTTIGTWLVFFGILLDYNGMHFNKKIWSTSFALFSGGLAAIIFANLSLVIDLWGWISAFQPFAWCGANSFVLYFGSSLWIVFSTIWIYVHGIPLRVWLIERLAERVFLAQGYFQDMETLYFLMSFFETTFWVVIASALYSREVFVRI